MVMQLGIYQTKWIECAKAIHASQLQVMPNAAYAARTPVPTGHVGQFILIATGVRQRHSARSGEKYVHCSSCDTRSPLNARRK